MDSLKLSCRWGFSPKADHTRCTVDFDSPVVFAIPRQLQWVSPSGVLSSVLVTSWAIFSSSMLRGLPERSSSYSPSTPWLTNRPRHLATVCRLVPVIAAISLFCLPSEANRTIWALST